MSANIEFMPDHELLTYDDFALLPEDGVRRELLDGELLVSPTPSIRHQELVGRLAIDIANHLEARGGGRVYVGLVDVVLSDRNVLEPDLVFITDAQLAILTEANVQGAPALVIEVLSKPHIDRVRKRDIYAQFGVTEYWIVDPESDWVEVYRLAGERYAEPEIFEPGETLTTPLLPGLVMDVSALLSRE